MAVVQTTAAPLRRAGPPFTANHLHHYGMRLTVAVVLMVLLYAGLAPDVQKSSGQRWVKSDGFHYMSEAARGAHEGGEHGHDAEHK